MGEELAGGPLVRQARRLPVTILSRTNIVRPLVGAGSAATRGTEQRQYVPFVKQKFTSESSASPEQMQRQMTKLSDAVEKATLPARTVPPFATLKDVPFAVGDNKILHEIGVAPTGYVLENVRLGYPNAYRTDTDSNASVREVLDKRQIRFTAANTFTADIKVYF